MTYRTDRLLWVFLVLILIYVFMSLGLMPRPATLEQYNLTISKARLLSASFVFPLIGVWAMAFYGLKCLRKYAWHVRRTKEGPAFDEMRKGVTILVFSLPIQGILGSLINYLGFINADYTPPATITRNYILMILFVSAFLLIARGCAMLYETLRQSPFIRQPRWLTLTTIATAALYVMILSNKTLGGTTDSYYLPTWLVVLTIAIPYLYAWSRALQGIHLMTIYHHSIKGRVYKDALRAVIVGIAGVTALNIIIQLTVAASTQLTRLNLTPLLLVVYLLVACYAIGFGLLARGSRKLTLIEEA